jgi:hypothetical protein
MPVVISGTDNFVLNGDSLGTAAAGALDYNGTALYFTPAGTQRGVVPGAQFFRLDSGLAGANVNTAQSVFGVGVTLSASTVYAFDYCLILTKSAGTTSHTLGLGYGGTATTNNFLTNGSGFGSNAALPTSSLGGNSYFFASNSTANQTVSGGSTSATITWFYRIAGTVSINAGGTLIPQYTLSAAPGGAYTTAAGSYFLIYPIGASGANVNVGTWA